MSRIPAFVRCIWKAFALGVMSVPLVPQVAHAQAETIRGRVTSDSGKVLAGATVFVTRGPDRLMQQVVTTDSGTYRVTFDPGTGDYLVAVTATGFKSARRRVTRVLNEREFTADFVLSSNVISLDAIKIAASKPVRASTAAGPSTQETGSAEAWREGVSAGMPPSLAGDINTTVSTIPGMVMGAGGPSMLGASSTSNLTTLNGMSLGTASLPRGARVDTRVTGATYDATRGGFSGANIDVRLGAGSRSFQNRTLYFTGDPRALQSTDAIGRAMGVTNNFVRLSGGADGEAIRGALTYNVALDWSRNTRDQVDLTSADALAYRLSGVSVDSVARARQVAQGVNLPLRASGSPLGVQRDVVSFIGRFDDTRDSTWSRSLTLYGNTATGDNEGLSSLSAPSTGAQRRDNAAGGILSLSHWSGPGFSTLRATRFNFGITQSKSDPYLRVPAVDVLVRTTADATANDAGIASLTVGGRGIDASNTTRWTAEANHDWSRNISGRTHQLRAVAWARVDGTSSDGGANTLGRYDFASLDDLANRRAASYSRTLVAPSRDGRAWNGALAATHTWNPNRFASLMYGARIEGNGFLDAPAENAALAQTLGVSTGGVSSRVHVSPRVGFTYYFNKASRNGGGSMFNSYGTWFRYPTGVLRGGIGEFRDLYRPDVVADAAARTGLTGSTLSLLCVGAAVPTPDFASASLPTQCTDGSGALGVRAPNVTLLDKHYDVPRSWRASLDYNTTQYGYMLRTSALGTYDFNQPSLVDANFSGTPRFTLAGEGGRQVFVSPTSIDATSGSVSAAEARRSADYGSVGVLKSDLHGRGAQLTTTFGLDRFDRRWRGWPFMTVTYTLQRVERESRGFDGAAWSDPRTVEWAPAASDARHIWLLQVGHNFSHLGTVTAYARLQSGLPFTPIVQGDVNGDGRSGDRAFVPDPSNTTDATLAAGIRSLQANGSDVARACLATTIAHPGERNGCRGSWTRTLSASWTPLQSFASSSWWNRVSMTLFANNLMAGVDQLLHGANNMRGWGGVASPDPVLLVPRSFDAANNRFRYDVNPRFAETRPSRLNWRDPFRLTLDVTVRLHTDYDLQDLRRAIEPIKTAKGWQRRTVDSLTTFYLNETSSIHRALVAEADTLFLTAPQIDQLRQRDSVFADQVRKLYRPLAEFLASQPDGVASKAALDSVKATTKKYWEIFWKQPEIAAEVLMPQQIDVMSLLKDMLTIPQDKRKGNQYYFGSNVTLTHTVAQVRKE